MKPEELERLDCCTVLTGIVEMLRRTTISRIQAAALIEALERKCGHLTPECPRDEKAAGPR